MSSKLDYLSKYGVGSASENNNDGAKIKKKSKKEKKSHKKKDRKKERHSGADDDTMSDRDDDGRGRFRHHRDRSSSKSISKKCNDATSIRDMDDLNAILPGGEGADDDDDGGLGLSVGLDEEGPTIVSGGEILADGAVLDGTFANNLVRGHEHRKGFEVVETKKEDEPGCGNRNDGDRYGGHRTGRRPRHDSFSSRESDVGGRYDNGNGRRGRRHDSESDTSAKESRTRRRRHDSDADESVRNGDDAHISRRKRHDSDSDHGDFTGEKKE
mmetsp:Transcript_17114/g.35804  ORF Transcript_17114/g.35804 Transcript_17114/m.35804 type:complete len:270 (-) Transcript_17114:1248-2057(-)